MTRTKKSSSSATGGVRKQPASDATKAECECKRSTDDYGRLAFHRDARKLFPNMDTYCVNIAFNKTLQFSDRPVAKKLEIGLNYLLSIERERSEWRLLELKESITNMCNKITN